MGEMAPMAMFFYRIFLAVFPCMPPVNEDRHHLVSNAEEIASTPGQAAVQHSPAMKAEVTAETPDAMVPLSRLLAVQKELDKQKHLTTVLSEEMKSLQEVMLSLAGSPTPVAQREPKTDGLPVMSPHAVRALQHYEPPSAVDTDGNVSGSASDSCKTPSESLVGLGCLSVQRNSQNTDSVSTNNDENANPLSSPSSHWISSAPLDVTPEAVTRAKPTTKRTPLGEVQMQSTTKHMATVKWSAFQKTADAGVKMATPSLALQSPEIVPATPCFDCVPNTTSKYQESKTVPQHSTPFEARVDRALENRMNRSGTAQ